MDTEPVEDSYTGLIGGLHSLAPWILRKIAPQKKQLKLARNYWNDWAKWEANSFPSLSKVAPPSIISASLLVSCPVFFERAWCSQKRIKLHHHANVFVTKSIWTHTPDREKHKSCSNCGTLILQKKQGVEPRRNSKILGLRLYYSFGNHVLQIPSNYFHSSAFHKRFSLQNAASFAWDDHNAVYHSLLCFRNLAQKILVLKGHPQGL